MENSIQKCKGSFLLENDDLIWSYRFFYKDDFGCRLFEVNHIKKLVDIYDSIENQFIKSISYKEFKEEFGNKTFLNASYFEILFKVL